MKGLVVRLCQCEIFIINSLSFSVVFTRVSVACVRVRARAHVYVGAWGRARFPLYSGMQPVSALLNPHSASKTSKPLIFFLFFPRCLLTRKRTPSLSRALSLPPLSAGMNAHVEMLARLHTRTKFSHTKAKGERGGGREGVGRGESGMKEPAAARSKAAAAPPR